MRIAATLLEQAARALQASFALVSDARFRFERLGDAHGFHAGGPAQ